MYKQPPIICIPPTLTHICITYTYSLPSYQRFYAMVVCTYSHGLRERDSKEERCGMSKLELRYMHSQAIIDV